MEHAPCISQIATLLADPKRSAMMWALMDGSARHSEELALMAGLSPSSASAHLGRLLAGGLLKVEARGRKRFFRLTAPEVGAAIEALASASLASTPQDIPDIFKRPAPWPNLSRPVPRCCARAFATTIWAAPWPPICTSACWRRAGSSSSISGSRSPSRVRRQLAARGVFIQALAHRNGKVACACPDWSERRPHLGGALGAALLQLFMQSGWLSLPVDSRALQLTAAGQKEIHRFAKQTEVEMAM